MPTRAWHQSSLAVALRCGEQYRRRYLDKDVPPATTALIRGTAVHRAVALGLGVQAKGELAPRDFYEDVAATEVERAKHGGATLTAEEASAGADATWGRVTDVAVACAGTYGTVVAPDIAPVAIEHTVRVGGVPGLSPDVELVGTVDVITLDDQDGPTELIRDDKTTERSPRGTMADTSTQLTMYSLLRSVETGRLVSRVALDHLVYSKGAGEAKHVHQPSRRTSGDLHALVRRIAAVDRAVQAGVFVPAATDDWWCSERWCSYWSTCPFAQGRR